MATDSQIFLSPPDVGESERAAIMGAFEGGWIAPVGPDLDAFEHELAEYAQAPACVALASGTAALHLGLLLSGVKAGDEVVVQSATFAASAFPVVHAGAKPVFIDSEPDSWCMDPGLLKVMFESRVAKGEQLPAAVMPVDLYGSVADYSAIGEVCEAYAVPIVRDAAEALGSVAATGPAGALGIPTALSFNGNKIITTSSGGALLGTPDAIDRARYLATQARQPLVHYEHTDIGYNYRMSNLLAALGRAQLAGLEEKIARRAEIANTYKESFPSFEWCPFGHTPRPNHWLSVALLPEGNPTELCAALALQRIEARPAWKPMHQQPVFADCEMIIGQGFANRLFESGVCLPSGSSLSDADVERVIGAVRSALPGA